MDLEVNALSCCYNSWLDGSEVGEHPPQTWEVAGLIPDLVIPKTLKMVVINGCPPWCSRLTVGVMINGPVVLVTYPGNAI